MHSFVRVAGRWVWVAIAALALAACGSSSRGSARAPANPVPDPIGNEDPPPAVIQGVATPSSVSVVTATNAN